MAGCVEGIVDCRVAGQEPLRGAPGLEPLHLPFPPSDGQVAVLCPIVFLQATGPMQAAKTQLIECGGIGFQAVGGDDLRLDGLACLKGI
jgi:hypothetical protein